MSDQECMDCGEHAGIFVSFDVDGTSDADCVWLCVDCADEWRHPQPQEAHSE